MFALQSTYIVRQKVMKIILLTKTTVAQNEDALSYHKVRGLYFLAVGFVRSIIKCVNRGGTAARCRRTKTCLLFSLFI